jgi:hypothetical protein
MLIDRLARRLHEKHILTANILLDLHEDLSVTEIGDLDMAHLDAQIPANTVRQMRMGAPGKKS